MVPHVVAIIPGNWIPWLAAGNSMELGGRMDIRGWPGGLWCHWIYSRLGGASLPLAVVLSGMPRMADPPSEPSS